MKYRTITDLPTELLHTIVSQLQDSEHSLRSSSLTCKRLRDVSLEFVFNRTLRVRNITNFDHLLRFLDTNPRALKRVDYLTLGGACQQLNMDTTGRYRLEAPIDVALVASVVDRLPSLQTLNLETLLYLPPTSEYHGEEARRPRELRFVRVSGAWTPQCSSSGLVQVLSLFSVKGLIVYLQGYQADDGDSVPRKAQCPKVHVHQPLAVEKLDIHATDIRGPRFTHLLLDALANNLQLDVLRDVSIRIDDTKAACALGDLLLRAGGSITALKLRLDAPFTPRDRDGWIDPLRGTTFV